MKHARAERATEWARKLGKARAGAAEQEQGNECAFHVLSPPTLIAGGHIGLPLRLRGQVTELPLQSWDGSQNHPYTRLAKAPAIAGLETHNGEGGWPLDDTDAIYEIVALLARSICRVKTEIV